ncbi:C40 family peptidase [Carnobacterium divergens]|uniref:hypothetical protein n=1 Tax=Carnobacterium divergens TaxID=2748 RepID=UPI00128B4227|nr:hypothetical protein [Carnobacterium divergens]MPQ23306.1 hypothetical protein [Carnobacterium divergens]
MKKILLLTVLLAGLFCFTSESKAMDHSELQSLANQFALTGDKLTTFETVENSRGNLSRQISVPSYDEFLNYQNLGILPEDMSYEDYTVALSVPEPTDPVDTKYRERAFIPQAGDMFITNGTSSAGLTGHAGIFLPDGSILSIAGYGAKPKALGIFDWMKNYSSQPGQWTKIYRVSSYKPGNAANWAIANIKGKNISYGLSGGILNQDPTYCSKIVYQSYYNTNNNGSNMILPSLILPYALPNVFMLGSVHVGTWSS